MDPAFAPGTTPKAAVFHDGLGERRRISDVSGADTIEQLCLRSDLTAIPSFEFALRERASRLANFRHVSYARVRSVDRLTDPASTLTVVSDSIKGVRLANLLTASERRPVTLDINASLHLLRQLVSAVAMLHETARDVAHAVIGPERIIVTPSARIVIAEYVLGAALEQLRFSRDRYWKELRIPLPPSSALPRFDHRADVTQIGAVALALVIRPTAARGGVSERRRATCWRWLRRFPQKGSISRCRRAFGRGSAARCSSIRGIRSQPRSKRVTR